MKNSKSKIYRPRLINAQDMHKKHPDTFEIPTPDELNSLKKGDMIKVANRWERFWVMIEKRDGDKIIARVSNFLIASPLKIQDAIEFKTKHIYSIQ